MSVLDRLHPATSFVYFLSVIVIAMLTMDPIAISMLYVSGIFLFAILYGIKKLLGSLLYSVPVMLMLACLNPLFVHKGETVLFFANDNPVTAEAIQYGFFASLMLMSLFYWFQCYGKIITTEKFICLFGKLVPRFALVFSMAVALIPRLGKKFGEIEEAQRGLGIYSEKKLFSRIRRSLRSLSILITWAFEGAVERADSMRARGYGLKRRSAYTLYRLTAFDLICLFVSLSLAVVLCILAFLGAVDYAYYPIITRIKFSWQRILFYAVLALLVFSSFILEGKERLKWHYLISRI